jgi:hypothetical protein
MHYIWYQTCIRHVLLYSAAASKHFEEWFKKLKNKNFQSFLYFIIIIECFLLRFVSMPLPVSRVTGREYPRLDNGYH